MFVPMLSVSLSSTGASAFTVTDCVVAPTARFEFNWATCVDSRTMFGSFTVSKPSFLNSTAYLPGGRFGME